MLLGKPNPSTAAAAAAAAAAAPPARPTPPPRPPSAEEAKGAQQVNGSAGLGHVLIAEILDQGDRRPEVLQRGLRAPGLRRPGRARRAPRPPAQVPRGARRSRSSTAPPAAAGRRRGASPPADAERGDVKPSLAALEGAPGPGAATAAAGAGGDFVAGENAFNKLGESEGVVDCMYCWLVRRDNFECRS